MTYRTVTVEPVLHSNISGTGEIASNTITVTPEIENTIEVSPELSDSIIEVTAELHSNTVEVTADIYTAIVTSESGYYTGSYEWTPTQETQTVTISGLTASQDITINPIPSNYGLITWDGSTLTVS